MKTLILIIFTACSFASYADSRNLCEIAVRNETSRLQRLAEQEDPNYTFNGIGDVFQEDEETYTVTFGFNEECQGAYQFTAFKTKNGKKCEITNTIELEADCG